MDSREQYTACTGKMNKEAKTARNNIQGFMKNLIEKGIDPYRSEYFINCDADSTRPKCWHERVQCLLSSQGRGHWVTNQGRRMKKEEQMRFQGINPTKFTIAVSEPELGKQIGNAMSQNVLERFFTQLLPAAGLVTKIKQDGWRKGKDAIEELENSRNKSFRLPIGTIPKPKCR